MEIYERIRELRKDYLHLSMEAFGNRLGVSRDVINNIEHNRLARPDQKLSLIKLMCKEFNINEEWLLTGKGEMESSITDDERIASFIGHVLNEKDESFKKRYISMLSSLDESGWEILERYAEMLVALKKD